MDIRALRYFIEVVRQNKNNLYLKELAETLFMLYEEGLKLNNSIIDIIDSRQIHSLGERPQQGRPAEAVNSELIGRPL